MEGIVQLASTSNQTILVTNKTNDPLTPSPLTHLLPYLALLSDSLRPFISITALSRLTHSLISFPCLLDCTGSQ